MNILDVLILAALAGGVVAGLRSGMIRQVLSLVGLVVAFLLATRLMGAAGAMAAGSLGISEEIAPLVGFMLVFGAVQVAVFVLGRLLEAVVGALRLGLLNRMLGGALGALKAGLALSVLFLVLGFFQMPSAPSRDASALYTPVVSVLPEAWDYVAEAFPHVESITGEVEERLQEHLPPDAGSAPDASAPNPE